MNAMVLRGESEGDSELIVYMDRGRLQFREIDNGCVDRWQMGPDATEEFVAGLVSMLERTNAKWTADEIAE